MNTIKRLQHEYWQLDWQKHDIYEANEICEEEWVYQEPLCVQRWIQIINGRMAELRPYLCCRQNTKELL